MNIRLKKHEQQKIFSSNDMYNVTQRILLRESKIDRNREHLWTISLDTANTILNIELVSMGSINQVIVHPMEVFSVPLQKRAVSVVLVHNHPSGQLKPSERDKDITDRLIQCGLMLNVPMLDHLIITEKSFFSFSDTGLLKELQQSKKYVPEFKIREELAKNMLVENQQKNRDEAKLEIAKAMKNKGYKLEEIVSLTGLSRQLIGRIKSQRT